ncbi:MAG: two-component regulator propeller domain-containing protein [Paludibacter sp.]|nr:two-component regulator propeller domain-containing protein [Paludibacter sp.]
MRKLFLLISILIFALLANAQYHFSFSHFTSDNGLSQNSITALMKDSKGYLWFGTRDGLNKFDGYNFTNYNSKPGQKYPVASNRILQIKEDRWGYIWVKTYDEMIYRLDPNTEELTQIQNSEGGFITDKINEMYVLHSGVIWLSTFDKGCYRITTSESTHDLSVAYFNQKTRALPNNIIKHISEDRDGNTWILTQSGLCYLEKTGKNLIYFKTEPFNCISENDKRIMFGGEGKVFQYEKRTKTFKTIELSNRTLVSSIASVSSNNYLFATQGNGFYTYSILGEKLQQFTKEKYPEMKTNDIQRIYVDRAGDAWMAIRQPGVLHYNPPTNKITYIASNKNEGQITNPNFVIFEDEKDILWIQPYFGFFSWFDRANNRLVPFYSAYNEDINTLFSYGVNHVLSDSQGVMWISTNRGNGFFKCTFLPDYFNHYLFQSHSVYSISNEIRSIFEDNKNRMWVACKDGSVHVFDQNKREIGKMNKDGRIIPGGNLEALVYNFCQDKAGNIWFATKKQGLFRLKPRGSGNSFQIENFLHNPNDIYSPANNDFYSIIQDSYGHIWAGSYGGGLHLIDEQNGKIRFFHSGNLLANYPIANCSKVRQVFADSRHHIWVATTEGFVVFNANFNALKNIKYKYYHKKDNDAKSLGANDVYCISEDAEANMWFGTFGGGLSELKTKIDDPKQLEFKVYDRSKGMPNNVVYTIIDDNNGNLWLTTENSIVKFNKKTAKFESFGKGNELENVEFSEASACLLHSGEICVGSKSGFYSFMPDAVKRRIINAPLVFTGLQLFNKEVEVGEEGSLLQTSIDKTSQIVFSSKQNVFTIEFATLDMRAPERIQYAYKLDGFDSEWNRVQSKHFATYTSLPPGTYTFHVKSTDSEGIWLQNERQVEIKILPSFWQSGFAKFLYALLVILLFLTTLYIFVTIFKLKNNVHLEKQMTDMKLRFFTDISHELRTPLTLISLPVDNILQENLEPAIKDQLLLIRRNLDRVMVLINQILDFRKIQNNKMRLTVEEIAFGEFIKVCCSNFLEIAHNKNIAFNFIDESNNVKVWVDPERFDSIISNLLSNAFKFTQSGKSITVKASIKQNVAVLSVVDEGIGIAQEKINFIFDRFFSISTLRNIAQKSTGIGLDLVKKLVDLHHAIIHVESQLGKGTTFEIEFKLGSAHFDDDVDIILTDLEIKPVELSEISDQDVDAEDHEHITPLIMIVEDNDELRHFLKKSLKKNYRVSDAENGKIGWEKIEHLMPDIIIADLIMPELDGLELTKKIKNDSRTSHIPVILLTAVTDIESKVAGMNAGADDYITKPFSSEFLHARIENLMIQRSKLQQYYRSKISVAKPEFSLPPLEIKSQEEKFMQNLIQLMNENLENFDLNIDLLASELGMSRTVFFNKLKSLTGFSPVEFVREIRFERAAEYIRDTQLTVSEISYKVGIEDPRYFSRCFKQKFGTTPSEYRAQHGN